MELNVRAFFCITFCGILTNQPVIFSCMTARCELSYTEHTEVEDMFRSSFLITAIIRSVAQGHV
jgi:hypothetical protein